MTRTLLAASAALTVMIAAARPSFATSCPEAWGTLIANLERLEVRTGTIAAPRLFAEKLCVVSPDPRQLYLFPCGLETVWDDEIVRVVHTATAAPNGAWGRRGGAR